MAGNTRRPLAHADAVGCAALAALCVLLGLFILTDQVWEGGRAVLMWGAIGYGCLGSLWLFALIKLRERLPFQFLIVLAFTTLIWVSLNWPHDAGGIKSGMWWAGYPWTYSSWSRDRLDGIALTADIGLFVGSVPALWVCVQSKLKSLPRDTKPD